MLFSHWHCTAEVLSAYMALRLLVIAWRGRQQVFGYFSQANA